MVLHKIILWLLLVLFQTKTIAQLRVPSFVSDNMVLQQNSFFHLQGKSAKGSVIAITTGWSKKRIMVTADSKGAWKVNLPTARAGGPYKLTIASGNETLVCKNILLGEVWICSGQSNMEWSVDKIIENGEAEAAAANWPQIRMLSIPQAESDTLCTDATAVWQTCTPGVMRRFSAVGYFFGRRLHKELNVPIGLINCNWGGTNIEAWMSPEPKSGTTDSIVWNAFKTTKKAYLAKTASVLYNAMLYPLHIFSVAGALWYQGEANVSNSRFYKTYLNWMVQDWRKLFGNNMSFYYVQIAPFLYERPFSGALLQEQQRLAMAELQNAGMVVTADIAGDVSDIHPRNKLDVGERLARWALSKNYKKNKIIVSGPVYNGMQREGERLRIKFKYADGNLQIHGDSIINLQIAGTDNEFVNALAKIDGKDLLVFHPGIKKPVAARMAFENGATVNLFNKDGLPASPFRTDNIPVEAEVDCKISLNGDDTKTVTLHSKDKIFYTLDGSTPGKQSDLYLSPIRLSASATLKARTLRDGMLSGEIFQKQVFVRRGYLYNKIELQTQPDEKYAAKGASTLNDAEAGENVFMDGTWLGFYDRDAVIKIDLGLDKIVHSISVGLLQSQRDWIFFPQNLTVFVSDDNVNFTKTASVTKSWEKSEKAEFAEEKIAVPANTKARFIKIILNNSDKIPGWHVAKGNPAWIFIDEVSVE